jgi:hypothetical protein
VTQDISAADVRDANQGADYVVLCRPDLLTVRIDQGDLYASDRERRDFALFCAVIGYSVAKVPMPDHHYAAFRDAVARRKPS